MSFALFDILSEPLPARETEPAERVPESIRRHLERLLRAHRGAAGPSASYGLPDVVELYAGLPFTLPVLEKEVEHCIRTYEPRLKTVRVQATKETAPCLEVEIQGLLSEGGTATYRARFFCDRPAEVALARTGAAHA